MDANRLRRCDGFGDGYEVRPCEKGCNASYGRCNALCEPALPRCSSDAVDKLERCAADGDLFEPAETCTTLCLSQLDGKPAAHCAYFQPPYDVLAKDCDALAATGALTIGTDATLDGNVASTCTGGVRPQIEGPDICVVRQSTIALSAQVKLAGARAFAFIADGDITIAGAIDAAADGTVDGPGGGTRTSGAAPSGSIGGGGAGFRTGGGDGGGGGAGGSIGAVPGFLGAMRGGYRAASSVGGGGGAALMFVSCKGTIAIDGRIDVGGGGGAPATAAGGGGSGGVLVIAARDVAITAGAQLYANGGGGGGTSGQAGADGSLSSVIGAPGGAGGGAGGARLVAPQNGAAPGGGGGGAIGYLLVYTAAGATPVLAPGDASPALTAAHLTLR